MTEQSPRRGRPPLLDIGELQRRAIGVVSRIGYDDVTMARVASEVGVSVRTLHRYFPSKADLVWGALDESFPRLRANLSAAPPELPVVTAIAQAIAASIDDAIIREPSGRERMRLIATSQDLQAAQSAAFRHWREDLAEFAAARLGMDRGDIRAVAIAAAVQSATIAALEWWAIHDEVTLPSEAVRRALTALTSTDEEHN